MIDKSIMDKIDDLDNRYVLDIVKNYKTYGYDREVKEYAENVLKRRKVPGEEMLEYSEEELEKESALKKLIDDLKEYFRIMTIAGILANLALAGVIASAILDIGWLMYVNIVIMIVFMIVTGIFDTRIIEYSTRIKELHPYNTETPDEGGFESAVAVIPSYFFMVFLPFYFTSRMIKITKFIRSLRPPKTEDG